MRRIFLATAVLLGLMSTLPSCKKPGPIVVPTLDTLATQPGEEVPTRAELIRRHNAAVAGLGRVWTAAEAKLKWEDPDSGKVRQEEGSGYLIMVHPSRVTLTMSKLGKTGLWAGSNETRFWLLDIQDRSEAEAWVGTHANAARPCSQPLPLPVPPAAVPWLLGLVPLPAVKSPTDDPDAGLPVQTLEGYWVLDFAPGIDGDVPYAVRMFYDPKTQRPARVDLLDAAGDTALTCYVSDYQPVEQHATTNPTDPTMPTMPTMPSNARCYTPDGKAELTLSLNDLSDGVGQINDRAFDFDVLQKAYRPRVVHDLDAGCGRSEGS